MKPEVLINFLINQKNCNLKIEKTTVGEDSFLPDCEIIII